MRGNVAPLSSPEAGLGVLALVCRGRLWKSRLQESGECRYSDSLIGVCHTCGFLNALNVPGRICKEPASVVGPPRKRGVLE